MKNVRLNLTENEKVAQAALGLEGIMHNMGESTVDDMLAREKANKFNDQVEKYQEQLEAHEAELKEEQERIEFDINTVGIKPMYKRLLLAPFKQNPFQKTEVVGGLLIGGSTNLHVSKNPITGKYEEEEQFIRVGEVVEIGPETRYVKPGDAVYYRKDTVVPVSFFGKNLVSLDESQVIAVVGEGIDIRMKNGN